LAAVIDEKYICLHAGVGKYLKSVEQIENIERPIEAKILAPETENDKILVDILWSDPSY
jgi:hypothetical protein